MIICSRQRTKISAKAVMDSLLDDGARVEAVRVLSGFRREFYGCLTARADALFELSDAVLCTDGPVTSLPELSLAGVHRRGHGAMYDALAPVSVPVRASRCRETPDEPAGTMMTSTDTAPAETVTRCSGCGPASRGRAGGGDCCALRRAG
jgi:hypothetical protein